MLCGFVEASLSRAYRDGECRFLQVSSGYFFLTSRGSSNWNVSFVSGAMVISLSPVSAAPAVPAPAPAPAPMAAPLPPPATAPMMAPNAAPPPAPTAVRLPRLLPDSVTSEVLSRYSCPFTLTELRVSVMAGLPLNLPADLASVTVPTAFAPLGITTLSPTTTGSAREASNESPELLVLELTD